MLTQTQITITNWKVMVDQFGMETAKKISKSMLNDIKLNGLQTVVTAPCHCNSEAIATFSYISFNKNQFFNIAHYEYTGTAN